MNCVAQSRLLSVAWIWIAVAGFEWVVPTISPGRFVGGSISLHTHVVFFSPPQGNLMLLQRPMACAIHI